jgi:ribosomal protein L11 methyltransferase
MANINRNILLNDMPTFRLKMTPSAQLLLSGFYTDDIPMLTAKAAELGLSLADERNDGKWACLRLTL